MTFPPNGDPPHHGNDRRRHDGRIEHLERAVHELAHSVDQLRHLVQTQIVEFVEDFMAMVRHARDDDGDTPNGGEPRDGL